MFTTCIAHTEGQKQLNVLLIMVDDLKPAISDYENQTAISADMNKLARDDMRFQATYSN